MKYFVYAVRDSKTCFMDPFVEVSDSAAIRGFCFGLQNQPGIVGFSPEDYSLYVIGEYEKSTGCITHLISGPKLIYEASDYFSEVNSDA